MKRHFLYIVLLSALVLVPACKSKEPKTTCLYGNDIPESELELIFQASEQLISLVVKGELDKVYEAGTEEMKTRQNRDQFVHAFDLFIQAFGDVEYPDMKEVYFMESEAKDESVWISCNLGEPGVNDLYGMPANRRFAVTVYRAHTEMEEIRVILQFEKREDQWLLRSLSLNPMTLKKKTYTHYAEKANEYREQNKLHLAVLYYKTSMLLSEMGLNVVEAVVATLQDRINQVKVDYMPGGETQIWATDSGYNYKVYNLDPAYDNGNLLVQISYLTESLKDRDKLKREAWDLARFLDKKFPEYRLGFDGIRVTAAPEARSEMWTAFHTVISFSELDKTPEKESGSPRDKKAGEEKTGSR
jgi:hypothetical protein